MPAACSQAMIDMLAVANARAALELMVKSERENADGDREKEPDN